MSGLPPADPLLVADAVAALPSRLRAKLDAAVADAAAWVVKDGLVRLPGGAEVVLAPCSGVLSEPASVRCACLLAPNCLHRASVLAAAPVAAASLVVEPAAAPVAAASLVVEPAVAPARAAGAALVEPAAAPARAAGAALVEPAATSVAPWSRFPGAGGDDSSSYAPAPRDRSADLLDPLWSDPERSVAELVWAAAGRVLDAGVAGAGAAVQGELLRAVHLARLAGLHRLAAATTRVVTRLRAARADDVSSSLADLTGDLLEVLEGAHAIRTAVGDPAVWRGQRRSSYQPVGGLRLTGLCLEPVVSSAGYAGVVVWLVDADGRTWSVSDVKPGGPERVAASAATGVSVGEVGLSHRELSRAGMILSGATANESGRLGAGAGVRAVRTDGIAWTDEPLAVRFGPLPTDPAGLLLLDLTLCGSTSNAVLAVDSRGAGVRLAAPAGAYGPTHRDNLRILGAAPGLRMLAVGRLAGKRDGLVELLAVGGGDLRLPTAYGGHADLGVDRLSRDFLRVTSDSPVFPVQVDAPDPLTPLRRRIQRVVSGGRVTLAATSPETTAEVAALRKAHLSTGADRLARLLDAGKSRERDAFGRLTGDDPAALSMAWLAAGVYEREVAKSLRGARLARPGG